MGNATCARSSRQRHFFRNAFFNPVLLSVSVWKSRRHSPPVTSATRAFPRAPTIGLPSTSRSPACLPTRRSSVACALSTSTRVRRLSALEPASTNAAAKPSAASSDDAVAGADDASDAAVKPPCHTTSTATPCATSSSDSPCLNSNARASLEARATCGVGFNSAKGTVAENRAHRSSVSETRGPTSFSSSARALRAAASRAAIGAARALAMPSRAAAAMSASRPEPAGRLMNVLARAPNAGETDLVATAGKTQ